MSELCVALSDRGLAASALQSLQGGPVRMGAGIGSLSIQALAIASDLREPRLSDRGRRSRMFEVWAIHMHVALC